MSVTADLKMVPCPDNLGGTNNDLEGWQQGKVIQKIRVYADSNKIKDVCIWLSGESEAHQYGNPNDDNDNIGNSEFTFQPGEMITYMSLWPGNENTHAGGIYFSTNQGHSFSYGPQKGNEVSIDVASGILVGAKIRAGPDVNSWGFYFLLPITSYQLKDVTYADMSQIGGILPVTLACWNTTNNNKCDINWTVPGSQSFQVSSTWSTANTWTFGMKVTVQACVPKIEVWDATWGLSSTQTVEISSSKTTTLKWKEYGTLEPGETIDIKVLTSTGNIDVAYSGTMVVVVNTGAQFTFPENATYSGVAVGPLQIIRCYS